MDFKLKALLGAVSALALSASSAMAADALPSFAEPALSPDGSEIAFASGGDLWTVPAAGGQARLLVTDEATESRPLYSPDGKSLAFVSTRSGVPNIYVLTLATGELRRLTFGDSADALDGWSRDGQWIYFTSGVNDVARLGDVYRVAASGGTPLEVSRERYLNEFQSAPSPDGRSVALAAKGMSSAQFWRNGHSHIDESELWLKTIDGAGYQKLLPAGSKHNWPMWSPDGKTLWYMSDESGTENLWRLPLKGSSGGGQPQQVTRFTDGRLLFPTIGYDGKTIVFERDFAVWRLDTATGQASKVAIALRGAPAAAGEVHKNETSFDSLALSPDGKKAAIIAHGEVFAVSTKDGGSAQRVTRTPIIERDPTWSPDSKRLVYVSERDRAANIYAWDFATNQETALTTGAARSTVPTWSPDGKGLAYVRDGREVRVMTFDPAGKVATDRVLFQGPLGGFDDTPLTWSPDSRWIAFTVSDRKAFDNVNVVSLDGGAARPVTFLANGNVGKVAWSPDGKYILVDMGQRSEDAKILRVDLLPNVPKFKEDAFRDLFKPADAPDKPAEPKAEPAKTDAPAKPVADAKPVAPKKKVEPTRIVFEGIRERAAYLPLGMDVGDPLISPDGKTLVFRARQAGQSNFYTYNLDELAKEPPVPVQLTSTRKPKGDIAFSPDSKEVWFLEGGTIVSSPIDTPKPKPLAANAELDVDFDVEKTVVFEQAWGVLNRGFYDPKFHGANWEALRQKWAPYIAGSRTGDELRRNINLMIGELNASHSGINKAADPAAPVVRAANLGLRFDREAYEAGKGLVVREVIALGPAALEGSIRPGETLVAVNGEKLSPGVNLDKLLRGAAGKRTVLTVADAAGKSTRDAVVRPISTTTATGLLYRQWVNDRRAYVDKVSGGQLGYVHIADMSDASLAQLYIDLDAQNQGKQGVVIDVRNNNGGYVNGHALDVFARRNYLMMTARDRFPVPSRQNLGQRALGLPTVLVTNESSLSDAEDFTEGYRSLGLGKVVGKPTAGWIIFTGGRQLIDGSTVRLPFIRIEDLRGQNMELNPRPVDVDVDRSLGEAGDAQLDAAVKVLLGK